MDTVLIPVVFLGLALVLVVVVLLRKNSPPNRVMIEPDTTQLGKDLESLDSLGGLGRLPSAFLSTSQICAKLGINSWKLNRLVEDKKIKQFGDNPPTYCVRTPTKKYPWRVSGYRFDKNRDSAHGSSCFLGEDGFVYDAIDLFEDMLWIGVLDDITDYDETHAPMGGLEPDVDKPIPMEPAAAEPPPPMEPAVQHETPGEMESTYDSNSSDFGGDD